MTTVEQPRNDTSRFPSTTSIELKWAYSPSSAVKRCWVQSTSSMWSLVFQVNTVTPAGVTSRMISSFTASLVL